jgi:hypothetical protein
MASADPIDPLATPSEAMILGVAAKNVKDAKILASSQGSTFEFNGAIGHITDIDASRSAGLIDTSDLSLDDGDPRNYEPAQLLEGDEVKIDGLFSTAETYPQIGDFGPLKTSVGDIDGDAVVTNVTVVYSTGEVVKLSLAFKLGGEAD